MPLDIQVGDLAERARRLMRLVGRIPFRLDETVVPIVTLETVGQPPYRSVTGAADFATRTTVTGGAASFGMAGVRTSEDPGAGAAVIDSILIDNGDAAAQAFSLIYVPDIDALAGFVAGVQVPNLETTPANGPLRRLPVRACTALVAALPDERIAVVRLQPLTSILVPWRATLYGGNGLAVFANSFLVAASASFHGTYYPDVANP